MSKNKFGLVFRMESEGAGAINEATAENTLAAEVGAAEAAEEVESATGDVTEVVTGIENATEASDELGAVQGSLEEAVESGEGVSPREAEHIQARLERVAGLLGTTTTEMGLTFRRESFGGSNSRLAATKMRLEFVKEWGKKIWELIKRAWEWVKSTVSKLLETITGSAERLEERLKALQQQVAEAQKAGKTIGTDKIKKSASVFSIDGTTSGETIKKFLANTVHYGNINKEVASLVAPGSTADKDVSPEAVSSHATAVYEKFKVGTVASALPKGTPDNAVGLILLPGNKAVIAAPKKVGGAENEIEVMELSVAKASEKVAEDYAPLGLDEMKKLVGGALAGAGVLKDFQKTQKNFEDVAKANIAHAEAMIKASGSIAAIKAGDDKEKATAASKSVQALKALHGLNVKAVDVASKHMATSCFEVFSGIGDVVAASLATTKAKEEKKD